MPLSSYHIVSSIGNTPLVQLKKIVPEGSADIFIKLEYFNPTGSYKDRMAFAMIDEAEKRGDLKPGMTVVEYTGGSTGTSLAWVCAGKDYKFIAVSSDAFAKEKLQSIRAFGAEVVIVPSDCGMITPDLIPRMREKAEEICKQAGTFATNQFGNEDAVKGYSNIGLEILSQFPGPVSVFCGAAGTGGMITGVSRALKAHDPNIKIVVLEPATSPVITKGIKGSHRVEGISPGFISPILKTLVYDEARAIDEQEGRAMARLLAAKEGIFAGISTGLNVVAALQLAKELGPGHNVITVACDSGMKYLSGDCMPDGIINVSAAVSQKHYPSLNGLRGISIILVVLSHLQLSNNKYYGLVFSGVLGVNVFFVLSGFLITSLCIKEQELTGTLSLKNFYIRRVLRIFPVAWLYIAVLCLFNWWFGLHIAAIQLIGAALYIMNFSYFRSHNFSWMTGHYWSLSVEEQFYLLLPIIFKKSRKVYLYAVLFVVAVIPVLCTLQAFIPQFNHGIPYYFTHYFIKFQSIAVGCLFALLAFKKVFDKDWLLSGKVMGNVIAIFLMFYLRYDEFYSLRAVYTNLLIALLTGYLIVSNIVPATDGIYRLLNARWLSFIGLLSYSIYIWQQVFVSNEPRLPWWMVTWPFNLAWIIGAPCLSYFLYERYFLKLKDKFSRIKPAPLS